VTRLILIALAGVAIAPPAIAQEIQINPFEYLAAPTEKKPTPIAPPAVAGVSYSYIGDPNPNCAVTWSAVGSPVYQHTSQTVAGQPWQEEWEQHWIQNEKLTFDNCQKWDFVASIHNFSKNIKRSGSGYYERSRSSGLYEMYDSNGKECDYDLKVIGDMYIFSLIANRDIQGCLTSFALVARKVK
jgi:hypothetical protein